MQFNFDCELIKKEMWKDPKDFDNRVEYIKNKYNISDELLMQIDEYLHKVRPSK